MFDCELTLQEEIKLAKRVKANKEFSPMAKIEEDIKCKHLLYWSREHGIELFNSWDLSPDDQKKLAIYRGRFEFTT